MLRQQELCGRVASGIGHAAESWAGRTSLEELTAMLARCRVVVANDSGGMHLAAAAGAPIVAVFGLTDPGRTGPLGRHHRVVTCTGEPKSRDIRRD